MISSENEFSPNIENGSPPAGDAHPGTAPVIEKFGRFELIQCLSAGGVGELFKARDTETGRLLLLRRLSLALSHNPQIAKVHQELMEDDSRAARDPNVLHLLEAGVIDERRYVLFEYFDGQPLSEIIKTRRMSLEEAIDVLRQVALGLRTLHQRRIIHGDVKPANILVGRDSRKRPIVKLAPTDLATVASEAMVSVFGELVGTPKYMSPEQIQGRAVTPRSDIFSLGIVAYEMLAGREPFQVDNALGYLHANCERDAVPLAQLDTSIPSEVSLVVARMMARDPTQRYRTCQSLLDDLDRLDARIAGDLSEVLLPGMDSAFAAKLPLRLSERRAFGFWHGFALFLAAAVIFLMGFVVASHWTPSRAPLHTTPAIAPDPKTSASNLTSPPEVPLTSEPQIPRTIYQPSPKQPAEADIFRSELAHAKEEARREIERGRFDVAMHLFHQLAAKYKKEPQAAQLREQMAWVAFEEASHRAEKQQDLLSAAEAFGRVARTYAASSWASLASQKAYESLQRLANQKVAASQWPEAVAAMNKLLEMFPQTPHAEEAKKELPRILFLWAESDLAAAAPERAVERLSEIITKYPGTSWSEKATERLPKTTLLIGEKRLAAGEFERAAESFAALSAQYPNSPVGREARERHAEALAKWAVKLLNDGDPKSALAKWRELARDHASSKWVKNPTDELREIGLLASQFSGASAEATSAQILQAWARRLDELGKKDEAEAVRRTLVRENPDSPEARALRLQQAEQILDQAMKLLLIINRGEEARGMLARIVAEFPGTAPAERAQAELARIEATPKGMVYLPGGPFTMGLDEKDVAALVKDFGLPPISLKWFQSELPKRQVDVMPFYIDQHEVTNAEYKLFVDATGYPPPPSTAWEGRNVKPEFMNHPVTHVTWHDAMAYAKWAGKRLPTEAEWEKAARGQDGRRFPWGNTFDPSRANGGTPKRAGTTPVGSFPDGVSPYGCFDMSGNVQEWTADPYLPYPGAPSSDEAFDPTKKVVRGGSWAEEVPYFNTCTRRIGAHPDQASGYIGFRCAKSPSSVSSPTR